MDWADINGVSLRYELAGAGSRTLVLLHEMGGTMETWDAVMPRLHGFRVLRFDLRGAGLSQKIRDLSFGDLVEDLRQLLDALGVVEIAAMAGVAVGAAVAAAFAARHPGRVAKLLLMAPATGIAPERREETIKLAASIAAGGLRARVDTRLDATYPARFRTDPAYVRAFRGRALANDPASYAAYYRMLLELDLSADLAAIACPTMVLAGTEDKTRPPERVARDVQAVASAVFEAVPSGHVMPALTPDLVADRLLRFIGQPRPLAHPFF